MERLRSPELSTLLGRLQAGSVPAIRILACCSPFFDGNDLDYDDGCCIIRREVTAAGKSRAFINDTPVPLSLLKEIGETLIDVHSQHKNLLLGREDFQISTLDLLAGNDKLLADYKKAHSLFSR